MTKGNNTKSSKKASPASVQANGDRNGTAMPAKNSRSKAPNSIKKKGRQSKLANFLSESAPSSDQSDVPSLRVTAIQSQNKKKASSANKPIRVYADGVFDMYHIGHARVLEQAKKLFPNVHLIVGVSGDDETIRKKGKIVMSQEERCAILRHCKWVDEIICPCPWVIDLDFLEKHDIDYVAHDDVPYGSVGQNDIYAEIKKAGKFKATQRTDGISTSDIILRIIQDYDLYVTRSMDRGYNRKQIGLSWSKFQRMKWFNKLKHYANQYEDNAKKTMERIENSPYVKQIKSHVKKLLGIEVPEVKRFQIEEDSDFDA